MSPLRILAASATAAALAACAALPAGEHVPRAAAFDLVGRVAVTHDGRAFTSGVRWQHFEEHDEIWLLTPTGQALAHILSGPAGATLTGADQSQYHAADAESLTRRALGWELPVMRLTWWARGEIVPQGHVEDALRDQQGRLVRLRQDGWQVTFIHPAANDQGGRPQRLELTRPGYQIRMVIDSWRQDSQ